MPISSDFKKSLILNGIASGFGWAGLGIGISSVSSNEWVSDQQFRYGLWYICSEITDGCSSNPATPELNATQAFMILYLIFILLGNITNVISQVKHSTNIRSISGGIMSISGTFGVIGTTVYTATIARNVTYPEHLIYEYGFWSAWGVAGGAFIAGVLFQISARYMSKMLDIKPHNKEAVIKL